VNRSFRALLADRMGLTLAISPLSGVPAWQNLRGRFLLIAARCLLAASTSVTRIYPHGLATVTSLVKVLSSGKAASQAKLIPVLINRALELYVATSLTTYLICRPYGVLIGAALPFPRTAWPFFIVDRRWRWLVLGLPCVARRLLVLHFRSRSI